MIENHGNISCAFVAFDRRGDGFVTLDELKRVLFNFAFPMSDKLFVELMDRYQNNTYITEIHHLSLCHKCNFKCNFNFFFTFDCSDPLILVWYAKEENII